MPRNVSQWSKTCPTWEELQFSGMTTALYKFIVPGCSWPFGQQPEKVTTTCDDIDILTVLHNSQPQYSNQPDKGDFLACFTYLFFSHF